MLTAHEFFNNIMQYHHLKHEAIKIYVEIPKNHN